MEADVCYYKKVLNKISIIVQLANLKFQVIKLKFQDT